MLSVEINLRQDRIANAAFYSEDGSENAAPECARILRDIAQKIENGGDGGAIMDGNGQKVGEWGFMEPEPLEDEEEEDGEDD